MSNCCKCKSHNNGEKKVSRLDSILTIIGVYLFVIAILIRDINKVISLVIYLLSYVCIGYEVIFKAFKQLFKRDMFDENFLMIIATFGAFAIGEYTEAVAVILLYKIGELLEEKAVEKAKKKISETIDIRADLANIKLENEIKIIKPEELKVGDIIVVKSGEKVPVDGILLSNQAQLDMSALTGESKPASIKNSQSILSGSINIGSVIEIKVIKNFQNSTISKVIDMIENSSSKKSNTERYITRFAKLYTPIVALVAIMIAIMPFFTEITYVESLNRAFTFLVISCPCALVISVPLGFFVGIGASSKKGILVKGSNYLDLLTEAQTVVFDKTGTLTKGVFEITKVSTVGDLTEEEIIEKVAMCEYYSNHYIAKSILNYYEKNIDTNKIVSHEEIPGKGLKVITDVESLMVGNYVFMKENNVEVDEVKVEDTIVYLSRNDKYEGYVILSDVLKEDSKILIDNLNKIGIKKCIMLTGDSENIAQNIASEIGINEVYSKLLPQDKVNIFETVKKKNLEEKIIYLGDGINDSLILARADIGIAMGRGSDIAIETADIVFMNDEPSKLIDAIKIAKKTKKIVNENIVFAIIIKVIILLLSSLGMTSMWFAIFADVGVAILTILNSIRIFYNNR